MPDFTSHIRQALMTLLAVGGLSAPAAQAQSGPPVVVDQAREQPIIQQVPVSGTVTAPRVARLSPSVSGLVREVLVDAGDQVEAGTVLLRLDSALAELSLQAAEAATAQAREELADARRRPEDMARLASRSGGVVETEVRARESEVRIDEATLQLQDAAP